MAYVQQPVASEMLRTGSTRAPAALWKIRRPDGYTLRLTSHDRALTYANETYEAGILATIGQLKREAGLVESTLEASGLIDGDTILIPDLRANLYRGAAVEQRIVDWRYPWVTLRQDYWRITRILHDVSGMFRGLIESRLAELQQNAGSPPYNGMHSQFCGANLADEFCTKDISGDTYTGVTVLTVNASRPKYVFEFDSGTFPAGTGRTDDYYRDGEVEWTSGNNVGTTSSIAYYTHSTRGIELFLPTPFPVEVGDQGTVRPGCDGLLATCLGKFNNVVNFRGTGLYSPGAQAVLSPEAQGNDP